MVGEGAGKPEEHSRGHRRGTPALEAVVPALGRDGGDLAAAPVFSVIIARMSLAGMPILILNLGGEMIYILDQRLRAQNIPPDKSVKVLQDVVAAMFTTDFVGELFKPQPLYSPKAARQIFDKLAHSSIMRLSTSSMNKLYDLMTMGFKYQLLAW